jgi:hypothetical protein
MSHLFFILPFLFLINLILVGFEIHVKVLLVDFFLLAPCFLHEICKGSGALGKLNFLKVLSYGILLGRPLFF